MDEDVVVEIDNYVRRRSSSGGKVKITTLFLVRHSRDTAPRV